MAGIPRDLWLSAVKAAIEAPPPPTDALSVVEFADIAGVSRCQASRQLLLLVKSGRAERTRKQIQRSGGGWMWVPAYRLVKQKDTKRR